MIDEKKLVKEICNTACIVPKFETDELLNAFLLGLNTKQICVMDLIANQPKIGEWIPCSERLPDVYKTVLITTYNQEVRTAFLDGEHYWFSGLFTYTFDDVLAWQLLPKSYEVKRK